MANAKKKKPRSVALPKKSDLAFKTIGEVSSELKIPQHVLRFWEGKFSQLRPIKRGGARRYYRPEDIIVLRNIQNLLYNDGYTIKGVQKILKESKAGFKVVPDGCSEGDSSVLTRNISEFKPILKELENIRKLMS
jgi:DNA-binding transcriptional MerR regulator